VVAALTISLGLTSPGAVRAQQPSAAPATPARRPDAAAQAEARERYERGIDLFSQGDYGGALAEFKRAYELTRYAVVLYNLGLTYAALGRPVEAAEALTRVLEDPGSLSRDRVEQARATRQEQAARVAELMVTTNVDGARIEVDGVEVAVTPLRAPLRVKGGPRLVGAVVSGYAPSRKQVDAAAGARTEVRLELAPSERRLGQLAVKSKVPGAEVIIDGERAGVTPLPGTVALLAGPHRVELRRPGYTTARTELVVGEAATAEVTLEPEEDQQAIRSNGGKLALDLSERDAVISIDGRSRGPYLGALLLAPGPHRLRVERAGFAPVERQVSVAARGTTSLRVELDPTPETRAAYVSKANTFRTLGWIGVAGGAALAGGGIAFLVYNQGPKEDARRAVEEFNATTAEGEPCNVDTPGFESDVCSREQKRVEEDQDSAYARDAFGWVGVGVGAAMAGTGVVLLLVGDDPGRYDRPASGWDAVAARPRRPAPPRGVEVVPTASFGARTTWLGLAGRF
jgi:tetratricopeptide (TPR) repeat protein